MSKVKTQLIIEGINKAKKAFAEVQKDLASTESAASKAGRAVAGALSVGALAAGVKTVVDTADAWQLMNARLKLATGTQEEFNTAQKELQRIASATASPIESLVTLYSRISRPLKEAGRSQQDIIGVTEAVAAAFKVSGASAAEAENGVVQFAQALGSGALRGDEFNSVAEQAPRLMQALADGIGVPVGALKEMAAQGLLTTSVVTDALLGELPAIIRDLAGFGDTVGGEMVKIGDTFKRGIGQADTGPLKAALKELNATLSDPRIQENLTRLAGALVTLAKVTAEAGSAFVQAGNDLAFFAAKASGSLDKITELDGEIAAVKASLDDQWSPGDILTDMLYSEDELKQKLVELELARKEAIAELTGISAEAVDIAERELAAKEALQAREAERARGHADMLSRIRDDQVTAKEDAIKREVAAEKAAQSELEKVRADRLAIEQRYDQALAEMRGGGGGEPSYGAAQALKVGAKAALDRGDIAGAQSQAQAALKMLQDLAAAGENTYGFEGFINSLRQIELAANDVEQTNAAAKIQAIKDQITGLEADAARLQNLKISFDLPPEEIERIKTQLQALSETPVLIPVVLQPTSEMAAAGLQGTAQVDYPGFATGGHVRGPGTGSSDSILARLSNGEYVVRAAAVRRYGTNLLDRLNGLQLPAFADGGLVSSIQPQAAQSLGNVVLNIGGESFNLQAGEADFTQLVRRQKLKRGSTRK